MRCEACGAEEAEASEARDHHRPCRGSVAALLYPQRRVMAVCGDGGFMMNGQELETAIRLKLNLVFLVIEEHAFGMIRWKQATDHFQDFGMTFGNPDFVAYAEAYRAKGTRIGSADDLRPTLEGRFNTRSRWCISRNLHHHDVFAPPVLMEGRNARHSWGKGLVYQPRKRAGLASRSMRPDGASYRQCDWRYLGRKRTDSTWGAPSGCAMMSTTSRSPAGPMMTFAASGLRPPLLDCALS
jgi:Thiamine pyrophosphate enzyme, C-terminal TPP binding domain